MRYRLYFAHGRRQVRIGFRFVRDGIDRYRFIALEWQ